MYFLQTNSFKDEKKIKIKLEFDLQQYLPVHSALQVDKNTFLQLSGTFGFEDI